jgi:glutamate 5-kinase
MMDCGSLIILSNVDGIYTGIPGCADSKIIQEIDEKFEDLERFVTTSQSGFGRGGMLTKCSIARKVASEGIHVYIANGTRDSIITDIAMGKNVPFTHFRPSPKKKNGVKKWLAHSGTFAKGGVYINQGAHDALTAEKATSLLMIGVRKIEGHFKKGDIIRIFDEKGKQIGIGKAQYDSKKAEQSLGEKNKKPLILYDYLLLDEKD